MFLENPEKIQSKQSKKGMKSKTCASNFHCFQIFLIVSSICQRIKTKAIAHLQKVIYSYKEVNTVWGCFRERGLVPGSCCHTATQTLTLTPDGRSVQTHWWTVCGASLPSTSATQTGHRDCLTVIACNLHGLCREWLIIIQSRPYLCNRSRHVQRRINVGLQVSEGTLYSNYQNKIKISKKMRQKNFYHDGQKITM